MCEYPYQLSGKTENNLSLTVNPEAATSFYKSNNSTVMDQIQQIVGTFPTQSKGKNMLEAVYKTEGNPNGNPGNRTNYGAWNKLTKTSTVIR